MLQSQSSTAEQSFPLSREEAGSLRYVSTGGLRACLPESRSVHSESCMDTRLCAPSTEGCAGFCRLRGAAGPCPEPGTNGLVSGESCSQGASRMSARPPSVRVSGLLRTRLFPQRLSRSS